MEVKGTAIKPMVNFVQEKYHDRFDEWIKSLPANSADIMVSSLSSNWYPHSGI